MATADLSEIDVRELAPVPVRRFSVEEYHQLAAAGVLSEGDRVELLEGWIVPKMNRNPRHDATIDLANDALRAVIKPGWRLRIQCAIATIDSEPEPDLALIRGEIRDWTEHHPTPIATALVVEVADSSLRQDRTLKHRLYARAKVPCYWIVNLIDLQLEVFTGPTGPGPAPTYRQSRVYQADEQVMLTIDGEEWGLVKVADLLP